MLYNVNLQIWVIHITLLFYFKKCNTCNDYIKLNYIHFNKIVFFKFSDFVPAIAVGTLGGALLVFCAFALYKQRQLKNKHANENAKKKIKPSDKRKSAPNTSKKGNNKHPKKCLDEKTCRKMMSVRKINIYDITNDPDEFDYLKDSQRCRCYSV